jgi:hypothetical protein
LLSQFLSWELSSRMADLQLKSDWVVIQDREMTEKPWTRTVLPKL